MHAKHKISLLFVILILALSAVACGSSGKQAAPAAAPTQSPAQPTQPPAQPTQPPAKPTQPLAQSAALGDEVVSKEGGYAFKVIPGYAVDEMMGLASMSAPDADPDTGPAILLISEPADHALSADELYAKAVEGAKGTSAGQTDITVDGHPGVMVTITRSEGGKSATGQVAVVSVSDSRVFTLVGYAPDDQWDAFSPLLAAVLDSVHFTDAAMTPPEPVNDVTVEAVNGYQDTGGYLNVVGLVLNYTDSPVENIRIDINVLDSSGTVIYEDTVGTDFYALAPGEATTFQWWTLEDLPDAASFAASVVDYDSSSVERAAVDVTNSRMTVDDNGDVYVTGELVNNGDQPVKIDNLAAAAFDSFNDLALAGANDVFVGYLDPGESGPFRVTMSGPAEGADDITDYQVFAEASVADPTTVWNITFGDEEHIYTDAWGYYHLVGEVSNNDTANLNVRLVAGFYDVNGVVLDADYVDLPLHALAPGETAPYDVDGWGPVNSAAGLSDQIDTYTIQWDPAWTWDTAAQTVDLSVTDEDNSVDEDSATFTGTITNDSGQDVDSGVVIVGLRDTASGTVVAADYTYLEGIPAGGSAAYEVSLDIEPGLDTNAVEYFVIAKGDLP